MSGESLLDTLNYRCIICMLVLVMMLDKLTIGLHVGSSK